MSALSLFSSAAVTLLVISARGHRDGDVSRASLRQLTDDGVPTARLAASLPLHYIQLCLAGVVLLALALPELRYVAGTLLVITGVAFLVHVAFVLRKGNVGCACFGSVDQPATPLSMLPPATLVAAGLAMFAFFAADPTLATALAAFAVGVEAGVVVSLLAGAASGIRLAADTTSKIQGRAEYE